MTDITLRPYQQKFLADMRNEFARGNKHVVGVAPCGSGKTVMAAEIVKRAVKKGNRVVFFVHRDELIAQTAKTFMRHGIEFGIVAAGYEMKPEISVQIASVQTLARRLDKLPTPDMLICDECHHILATTYRKIIDKWPKAFLLGLTATPQRMGGINLGDVFDAMVESLTVDELIANGNLTPFKYYAPDIGVNLSGVRSKFGEYVTSDIDKVMNARGIIGGIVENYRKLADGKQAICYCVNVRHSKTVAEAFNKAGIPAAHIDGDTDKNVRRKLVEDFRTGRVKVLCNAELFGEGFDVPNCHAVILARPTKSLTLYNQQAMRALRPDPNDPNKVAVIIDHVQNYSRHGLPNSQHDWSLDGKVIDESRRRKPRLCPKCEAVVSYKKKSCPCCGYEWPPSEADEEIFDEQDGTLVEIDVGNNFVKAKKNTPEYFQALAQRDKRPRGWAAYKAAEFARTYNDFCHIAKVVGYKLGWAWYQWLEREANYANEKTVAKCPPYVLE